MNALWDAVRSEALAAGLDDVGVCAVRAWPEMARVREWVESGRHGGLGFMEEHLEMRTDPAVFFPGARSLVMVVKGYGGRGAVLKEDEVLHSLHGRAEPQIREPVRRCAQDDRAGGEPWVRVARYATFRDYHDFFKDALARVKSVLRDAGFAARAFSDAGPVAEKILAVRAGLGVRGQNGLLIHPRCGSFVVLGGVVTNADLGRGQPGREPRGQSPGGLAEGRQGVAKAVRPGNEGGHGTEPACAVNPEPRRPCGGAALGAEHREPWAAGCLRCGRCLAACPTGALLGEGLVDAGRCLARWTVEGGGEVPAEVAAKMAGWAWGCDVCQEVCPLNEGAASVEAVGFYRVLPAGLLPLRLVRGMGEGAFESMFAGTPIGRAGLVRWERNVRGAGAGGAG